jgi:adenylate cyclase
MSEVPPAAGVRDLLAHGEYLVAYDLTQSQLARIPNDIEMQYLSVLALARAGATTRALDTFDGADLASRARSGLPHGLSDDIHALRARLDKDRALEAHDPTSRVRWARRAADGYQALFERSGDPYPGVNAATMRLLAGERPEARRLARLVLEKTDAKGDRDLGRDYWSRVTRAEALLHLDDAGAARYELVIAGQIDSMDLAARASTHRQLGLVCRLLGMEPTVLDAVANPAVIHFCGHRADPSGTTLFDWDTELEIRRRVDERLNSLGVGFGYGSLASGADIIIAEALLDAGAELHVTLPFAVDEFVAVSVADGGPGWVSRFRNCMSRARTVTMATEGEYLEDATLFDYCARLAMGNALMRAQFLQSTAHQIAVWDGNATHDDAGTATDVHRWSKTGNEATIISVEPVRRPRHAEQRSDRRTVRALIFADTAGFSRLTDAQVLTFDREVHAELGRVIDEFGDHVLSRGTWGDGIYLVIDEVGIAAECALNMQRAVTQLDLDRMGLGALRGLRIGLHVGPVFETWDPIARRRSFTGAHVTRAARIEPRTPEGEVYVTDSFAALATLEASDQVRCEYVGRVPMPKDYGVLPMYVLKFKEAMPDLPL